MSELEELPSWAGRSTDGEQLAQAGPLQQTAEAAPAIQPIEPRGRRPWKIAMLALFGIAALLGMGVLGYLLAEQSNSSETATEDAATDAGQLGSEELTSNNDATTDADATATDGETTAGTDATATDDGSEDGAEAEEAITVDVDEADATTDDAAAEDDAATEEDPADTDAAETEAPATEGADSGRRAVFRGGKVYLSGEVPSEEIEQVIVGKAAAVVGPDNVVSEYTINPEATINPGDSTPLYVEDVVLFEFNSIEVARPFFPILDLGTLLLRQNPQASVTVITRTDAVGSEEINLDVSRRRAQAIVDYWIKSGVNSEQIISDPRGEEGASEEDDEQTQAMSRRAEFVITGLLD